MHPDIRTYGRLHGRSPQAWPLDIQQPPAWFIPAAEKYSIVLPAYRDIILEVGCGMGESLWAMCLAYPATIFIAVEIYQPGLVALSRRMVQQTLSNLIIIQGDILSILPCIPEQSLQRIHVYFPDPWPKARHHKRRLHRGPFLQRLERTLLTQGRVHLATDIEEYAEDWHKHVPQHWQSDPDDVWIQRRQHTKYEARGQRLGHNIIDRVYVVGTP